MYSLWVGWTGACNYNIWLTITPHLITIKCPSSLIFLNSSYDCGEVFVNGIQKISGLLLFSLHNTGFMVYGLWCLMALSTIFHISVILVEETRVPRENHRPVASH